MDYSGKLTKSESIYLKAESEKILFYSNFDFLMAHNGFRPKNIHTFIGVSHGGKSTLVRTLILDALANKKKKKVLLWLSEETRIEFLTEFSRTNFEDYDEEQLMVYSELDESETKNPRQTILKINEIILQNKIDIVFYDNITTGVMYMDKSTKEQSEAAMGLKRMCMQWNVPLVIFAHTGSHVTADYGKMIEITDVRGSKVLTNISQFFYVMQSFYYEKNKRLNTIKVLKHRGQEVVESLYELIYVRAVRVFGKDESIPFTKVKEIFKKRDKLL